MNLMKILITTMVGIGACVLCAGVVTLVCIISILILSHVWSTVVLGVVLGLVLCYNIGKEIMRSPVKRSKYRCKK